jgi:hypothetical protein
MGRRGLHIEFGGKARRKDTTRKTDIGGKIILKRILDRIGWCELD